ncbi:hypothetical protein [Pseudomonas sp. Marseille-Q0931]|uniref:hypothetical protein n=1 Tax=Pseudomonas sp. Marseille-Q0931 TaxID=2697507 RepID=UPI0023BA08DC|nr:hypothetical protein [Pseudomonas sp. Marseille-Q0931]
MKRFPGCRGGHDTLASLMLTRRSPFPGRWCGRDHGEKQAAMLALHGRHVKA